MINIVTSICVDNTVEDSDIHYPQLGSKSREQRKKIYWKLATNFICSSVRCNPHEKHIIYTNDLQPVILRGIDIKARLHQLGVEVRFLPFETFVPPAGFSQKFKNAFYKLDVIKALGTNNDSVSLLLDSDCLWTQPNESIKKNIGEKIILYDIYKRDDFFSKSPHNLSRYDMGQLYSVIEPNYPEVYPIWYGGELIGGKNKHLQIIANELERVFQLAVAIMKEKPLVFANGKSLFDGDEYIASFVYNKGLFDIVEAKEYIKRIWTLQRFNNVSFDDFKIPIWHLPNEKNTGLALLFNEVVNNKSKFWNIPIDQFNEYLGSYVGIPKRKNLFWNKLLNTFSD